MSASLVGSEMCIRDSPSLGCRSAGHASVDLRRCDVQRRVAPTDRMATEACLLYTSDAADDM
eukprot:7169335-Alexandrium_andersonii.AAC.1